MVKESSHIVSCGEFFVEGEILELEALVTTSLTLSCAPWLEIRDLTFLPLHSHLCVLILPLLYTLFLTIIPCCIPWRTGNDAGLFPDLIVETISKLKKLLKVQVSIGQTLFYGKGEDMITPPSTHVCSLKITGFYLPGSFPLWNYMTPKLTHFSKSYTKTIWRLSHNSCSIIFINERFCLMAFFLLYNSLHILSAHDIASFFTHITSLKVIELSQ